jgi:hypothetical protein
MQVSSTVRLAIAAGVLVGAFASTASAEIVYLTSGRTLSVKSHRDEGNAVILTLRAGGDVTCDKGLIVKIEPDEVPHPDPVPAVEDDTDLRDPSILQSTPYGEIISALSEAHGVDPLLVRALIQVESNYQPRARSSKGAMGLMQIMPATAREYRIRNPYDPKTNIEVGVRRLKDLLDKWGAVDLALAAYNAGEGAVQKFQGIPPYRETRSYVTRILALAGIK